MRQPWICPKCNTAYAPWIDSCVCGLTIQPTVYPKPITIFDPIFPQPTTGDPIPPMPNTWGETATNKDYRSISSGTTIIYS